MQIDKTIPIDLLYHSIKNVSSRAYIQFKNLNFFAIAPLSGNDANLKFFKTF